MGSYSFKSSGKTRQEQIVETITKSVIPIGIRTPLRLGEDGNVYAMNLMLVDQIHDNLRNMLMTNFGERLGLYDFGSNLRPLVSEFTTQDDFDAQAVERIQKSVARWMPFVSLEDFTSTVDHTENKNTGIVRITITYSVPTLNSGKRTLQVTLYVM